MKKKATLLLCLLAAPLYFAVTALIGFISSPGGTMSTALFMSELKNLWWLKFIIVFIILLVIHLFTRPPLDIKDWKVGNGQHGNARYMEPDEVSKQYLIVPFGQETQPGFLVGLEPGKWVIDTSDNNMMLLAPPGAGKTTAVYIPTVEYNARVNINTHGKGASLLLVDIKGTLYDKCAPLLQSAGYRTPCLNLREVFNSYRFNLLYRINQEIDQYKAARTKKEKAIHYGMAERYAKITAASIIDSKDKSFSSEGSDYFNEAGKGLVIGLILLVSEYAPPKARHIMSVYDLLIQLNSQDENSVVTGLQTTKLAAMMKNIKNKRIQGYVGAATGADIRTTLNIFSSALAKLVQFVDAELEQLVCDHSVELEAGAFIEQPTAIFIICPDENPTRHFLASLFIRSLANNVIELAETEYNGVLPREVFFCLDEFGNLPAIQHIVSLFSAIRSRGGRILCALQSYAQLLDNYSQNKANIIRDTCQMLMFSFVSPSAESTATTISKMLGNETILSGSRSVSRGVTTSSSQMVGRPLLSPSQLVTLPFGTFITLKGTENPYKAQLKGYWEYLDLPEQLKEPAPELEYEEIMMVSARFIELAASGQAIILKKGMFD